MYMPGGKAIATRRRNGTRLLLLLVLLLPGWVPLTLPASYPPVTSPILPRVQPELLRITRAEPEKPVRVIIQVENPDRSLYRAIQDAGGEVTATLDAFDAIGASLPGGAVASLSGMEGVHWISLDAPVEETRCRRCIIDTEKLGSAYVQTVGASRLWNEPPYLLGTGIGVAIVDSGISPHPDISSRIRDRVNFSDAPSFQDSYGHGTHIAGIVGGDGKHSDGEWVGMAPRVTLINVKVGAGAGGTYITDVLAGLHWIYHHRDRHNIRVVNLSLTSTVPDSYLTNPLNAALELLWFSGIVVTVPSGNIPPDQSPGVLYPPANDPFLITVGAIDDQGTPESGDDMLAAYSAYGTTESGFAKPDVVAPGSNIVSLLSERNAKLSEEHRSHRGDRRGRRSDAYFRMSGTSMASAVTAGAIALLLQAEPHLTPDEVKYRLMATTRPVRGPAPLSAGAGVVDIYSAVHSEVQGKANQGIPVSRVLWQSGEPVEWGNLDWRSLNWGSLNWGSLNWGSLNWGSLNWGSLNWGSLNWGSLNWGSLNWGSLNWDD